MKSSMETFSLLPSIFRGFHRWPVTSPHKGQWRGALMFSWICAWINGWVNNREAVDLRRHRSHYDVTNYNESEQSANRWYNSRDVQQYVDFEHRYCHRWSLAIRLWKMMLSWRAFTVHTHTRFDIWAFQTLRKRLTLCLNALLTNISMG